MAAAILLHHPRGVGHVRRHLNFCQISHRFTSSFANPPFQDLNGSYIMYWNMIISNPSWFEVEPHSKYWYFCIERWDLLSLRFLEKAVLFYIEWLCRKTAGNVNRPPYRYTAVTHWACPPSSGIIVVFSTQISAQKGTGCVRLCCSYFLKHPFLGVKSKNSASFSRFHQFSSFLGKKEKISNLKRFY